MFLKSYLFCFFVISSYYKFSKAAYLYDPEVAADSVAKAGKFKLLTKQR